MSSLLTVARQMGPRWTAFQVAHQLRARLGVLRRRFPADPRPPARSATLNAFREDPPAFFFDAAALGVERRPDAELRRRADQILAGRMPYFSADVHDYLGDGSWRTHPLTGRQFPLAHWSEVPDFDPVLGDIKYVWEPSRFSHLYTLIRDDHHNGRDHGAFVLGQIDAWIEANPINRGPNYKCSQEISLRLLNWTFALHYYRRHEALTQDFWQRLQHTVYWSLHHVRRHINFSRIAVRNNHAITETTTLWLGGLLYPDLPDVAEWSREGKAWLEEEVAYQIHEDGTYLQHSHNYQRVVVQLLSWGLRLGELHGDRLSHTAYARAGRMLHYLTTVMQPGGALPNYGANDGALFFPLAAQDYRDYRPQLDALARVLAQASPASDRLEEGDWLGLPAASERLDAPEGAFAFPEGGIYVFRQGGCFAFVKAQAYRDRPSQADNLHLDLWVDGVNLLRDQGTFRYNADEADRRYFFGTASHNAVMVDGHDQMEKGPRFIFYNWPERAGGAWAFPTRFEGWFEGFRALGRGVVHRRSVEIDAADKRVTVADRVEGLPGGRHVLRQIWHPHPAYRDRLTFQAEDADGDRLDLRTTPGYYSGHYGQREEVEDLHYVTDATSLTTTIRWA